MELEDCGTKAHGGQNMRVGSLPAWMPPPVPDTLPMADPKAGQTCLLFCPSALFQTGPVARTGLQLAILLQPPNARIRGIYRHLWLLSSV